MRPSFCCDNLMSQVVQKNLMVKAPDGADVDSIILLDNLDWLKLSRHSIPACTWVEF